MRRTPDAPLFPSDRPVIDLTADRKARFEALVRARVLAEHPDARVDMRGLYGGLRRLLLLRGTHENADALVNEEAFHRADELCRELDARDNRARLRTNPIAVAHNPQAADRGGELARPDLPRNDFHRSYISGQRSV
jgi:hypothetical protein